MPKNKTAMNFLETEDLVEEKISFPVTYDNKQQAILDSKGSLVCDIGRWGNIQFKNNAEERQDGIGEKIAKLLNDSNIENSQSKSEEVKGY